MTSLGEAQEPSHDGAGSTVGRERVLVVFLGWVANVARVLRQVDFLESSYEVVIAAFDRPPELSRFELIQLPYAENGLVNRAGAAGRLALRLARQYEAAYWLDARLRGWRRELERARPFDAVLVNDLYALPLAHSLGAPVVFDAHEHWTSESASWTRWQRLRMQRAHERIVDDHVPRAAGMMTVSNGILEDYQERTRTDPALVTNAPFYRPLSPSAVTEPIRLLHIGYADERRRLEDTIEAVRSLDSRFTLDLVLARENEYRGRLVRLAETDSRIRVLPGIANQELITFANAYDVGVFLLPARFPNQVHVLPNKLFDYIQARLAVAIGPSPEMAAIVNEWSCGVVSESFSPDSFAAALDGLSVAEVERMKRNADRAARVMTADNNRETVLELVKQAIANGRSGVTL
jgi:Glycosyltransferase Family 4